MRMGGHLYVQIYPLHASVKIKNRLVHGTVCAGIWRIESRPWNQYDAWSVRHHAKVIRIF
jgi:hypothetical protein